jgi:hypothetical protein
MISIEVDGEDALYQVVLPGIRQALGSRIVAMVELNVDELSITDGADIKDAIMERYREFANMLAEPDVAVETAVTAVAKERGMDVIRIKAIARAMWVLYK